MPAYPYYPQPYTQNYTYYPIQNQPVPQTTQQPQQNQSQQVQNGGFMMVPSEEIVKTYPVAPGNCVTFKIEGQPIVIEKSMGFSNLEAPKIERYRLVKEYATERCESALNCQQTDSDKEDTIKELERKIDALNDELEALKEEVRSNSQQNPPAKSTQNSMAKRASK